MNQGTEDVKKVLFEILQILIRSPPEDLEDKAMNKTTLFLVSVLEKVLGDLSKSSLEKKVFLIPRKIFF